MKFLYVDTPTHHKNRIGFILMCEKNNVNLTISKDSTEFKKDWDLVFIPSEYIPPFSFPNAKRILYGPGNFVFVNGIWKKESGVFPPHCSYNLLSEWVIRTQEEFGGLSLPPKKIPFPIDIEKFSPTLEEKSLDCFVYFKSRQQEDLQAILSELRRRNLSFKVIQYGSYKEEEYLQLVRSAKFGIWVGCHESQGFALQECLSCNTPLLVWSVSSMFQEYTRENTMVYRDYLGQVELKATSVPYWDSRCGLVETEKDAVLSSLNRMLQTYKTFQPREFILDTLSPKVCYQRLLKELESLS